MATPQRGPRAASRQGDVTGQRAKALAEEHEAVVNDRRDEISTITHTQRRVRDEGVVDLTGDAPVLEVPDDLRDEAESTLEPLPEPVGAGKNINNGPRARNGEDSAEVLELPEDKPRVRGITEILPEGSENDPVTILVLFDLDDVTLGIHNTMSFKEGRKYRLRRWMGDHLVEKNLATMLTTA
jgi:hypothetical protein